MIVQSAILYKGKVYVGRRHPDIIRDLVENYKFKPPISGGQGFVTNTGEYLDRKQARAHFIASGQISVTGKLHPTELFSEDLYAGPNLDT